jgi:hypothetical protein
VGLVIHIRQTLDPKSSQSWNHVVSGIIPLPFQGRFTRDRVNRCLRCGKRMVPAPDLKGRTELKCVFCDHLDPMKMEAGKWADSPLATPVFETAP